MLLRMGRIVASTLVVGFLGLTALSVSRDSLPATLLFLAAAAVVTVMGFNSLGLWHKSPGSHQWSGRIAYTGVAFSLFIAGMRVDIESPPYRARLAEREAQKQATQDRKEAETALTKSSVAQSPPTPTTTPIPPTATRVPPTSTPSPPTPTPGPSKDNAEYVDPREITANPKAFVGRNIFLQGRTLTVQHADEERGLFTQRPSQSQIQVLAAIRGRSTTESLFVAFFPKEPKILKDECYRFYGVVTGVTKACFVFTGAETEVPEIRSYDWAEVSRDRLGFGCEPP